MNKKTFEIINPSDECYLIGEFAPVSVATILLGRGAYGAECIDNEELKMPLFLLADMDDVDKWFVGQFGTNFDDTLQQYKADVVDVLESFVYGDIGNYQLALAHIPDEGKADFRGAWRDKYRSSMNNIGANADWWAKKLREE